MTTTLRSLGTLGALTLTVLLGACSGSPSSSALKDAINTDFQTKDTSTCWKLPDSEHVTFPARIPASEFKDTLVRRGVINQGFITAMTENGQVTLTMTPAGEAAKVWDPKKGFCVGDKEVLEIKSAKPASDNDDSQFVTYTWQMTNVPAWAKTNTFTSQMPGMLKPDTVEAEALVKQNGTWVVDHGAQ